MKHRLEKLRDSLGMSKKDVAEYVGVSSNAYQEWEKGSYPKAEYGIKLSELYGVTLDYLYLGRESVTWDDLPEDLSEVIQAAVTDLTFIGQKDKDVFLDLCGDISRHKYALILGSKK